MKALTAAPWARRLKYIGAAAAALVVATGAALGTSGWRPFGRPAGPPRVAVLPFENLSAQPDSDAFALGLSYEIQKKLASIQDISLISFAASSAFPAKGRILRQAAAGLGADLLLVGSIFRADGALKITAQLVRDSDNVTLWIDSFDRKISDVFTVQDDISKAIVDELRLNRRWQKTHTTRPDLLDLFMRAQILEMRRDAPSARAASALYEQVVEGDPEFAPAWAGLANALATEARRAWELPAPDRIQAATRTAIQLDENLAEAQIARANVFALEGDWPLAEEAFLRAIALNPSATEAYLSYVNAVLTPQGRFDDALRVLQSALSIDPSAYVGRVLALIQVDSGDYERAIQTAQTVFDRDPTLPWTQTWLARAQYLSGREQEALETFQKVEGEAGYRGYFYGRLGRRDEAEALAAQLPQAPAVQMLIYAGLGDRERAFQAFERAVQGNFLRALVYLHRPEMALIHHDPRVLAIKRQLGLPR